MHIHGIKLMILLIAHIYSFLCMTIEEFIAHHFAFDSIEMTNCVPRKQQITFSLRKWLGGILCLIVVQFLMLPKRFAGCTWTEKSLSSSDKRFMYLFIFFKFSLFFSLTVYFVQLSNAHHRRDFIWRKNQRAYVIQSPIVIWVRDAFSINQPTNISIETTIYSILDQRTWQSHARNGNKSTNDFR